MYSIANCITISRLILAPCLFFVEPLSTNFYIIYILCGVSDVLDGYIARRRDTISEFGAKLDSVADMFMVCILVIILWPILGLSTKMLMWVFGIVVLRMISLIVVLIKYKTFIILHTFLNKITGLLLFLYPFILVIKNTDEKFILLLCSLSTLSALEELLIHIISTVPDANKRSIFSK